MARLKTQNNDILDNEIVNSWKKVKRFELNVDPSFFADATTTGPVVSNVFSQPLTYWRHSKTIVVDDKWNIFIEYFSNTAEKPTNHFVWNTRSIFTIPEAERNWSSMFAFRLIHKPQVQWGDPSPISGITQIDVKLLDGRNVRTTRQSNFNLEYTGEFPALIANANVINSSLPRSLIQPFPNDVLVKSVKFTWISFTTNDYSV
jgi:hypothetical protein